MRLAILISLLGLSSLPRAARAVAADDPADIRAVLLVKGSAAFKKSVARLVELPLGQEIELVPLPLYHKAAKRAHVFREGTVSAAFRISHAIHLTHAITVSQSGNKAANKMFMEVVVARLRPRLAVVMAQRFVLPARKLTDNLADIVVERVKQELAPKARPPKSGEKPFAFLAPGGDTTDNPPSSPSRDDPTASSPPRPRGRDRFDTADAGDDDSEDTGGLQITEDDVPSEPSEPPEDPATPHHVHTEVGLAVTSRTANLTSTSGTAPCYCGSGPLYNVFAGIHLSLDAFFGDDGHGFGILTDGTLGFASTPVKIDTTQSSVSSVVQAGRAAISYRWAPSPNFDVAPVAGYGFYHFPLSDGPFPGLSYAGPLVGAQLRYHVSAGGVSLWLGGGVVPFVSSHDEAALLGQQQGGLGYEVEGGVRVPIGPINLGLELGFTAYDLSFSGETFLYTTQRFANVSLQDQTLQAFLTLGSRFW